MTKVKVSPSILSADFANLQSAIIKLDQSNCDWIHFDVMDGHFVKNLTFGPVVIKSLRKYSKKLFDVHLMMDNPLDYLEMFVDAGSDQILVHVEAKQVQAVGIEVALQQIKVLGIKAGLVVQPNTDISVVYPFLQLCDVVLVMSVYAGFGGQSFIVEALNKIKDLKQTIIENNYDTLINVDGGINDTTIADVIDAGADIVVAGSYIFNGDINQRVDSLK